MSPSRTQFISVAVVEDDEGICKELEQVLNEPADIACVCICRNARGALCKIPSCAPDVILMDIELADGSGVDCAACLKRLLPQSQIVMYTVSEDDEVILKALKNGASGYILKQSHPDEVIRAVREVMAGGVPLTPSIARKVIQSFRREAIPPEKGDPLTVREEEILELLSRGFPTKEIAQHLSISGGTVASHLKHIYGKLHVRSRTEAVIKYLEV
jgi:DNA-binding NarL/FixJ family response regulator